MPGGLRRAERRLKVFGNHIRNLGLNLAGIARRCWRTWQRGQSVQSMGDQVAGLAKRTDLSVETLSELRFPATRTGMAFENLDALSLEQQFKLLVDLRSGQDTSQGRSAAARTTAHNLSG